MEILGHVEIPQEVFIATLLTGEGSSDRDIRDRVCAAQKAGG